MSTTEGSLPDVIQKLDENPENALDSSESDKTIATFFSQMKYKFSDVELGEDEKIPVETFLNACRSIVPIFDLLGPTLFSPVNKDIQGNINKINKKYTSDSTKFTTLQDMVLHEIEHKDEPKEIDATDALLWLKRALDFISVFLKEFIKSSHDLCSCANTAYTEALKPYHGWIVRGIFTVIVRAMPSRTSFIDALAPAKNGTEEEIIKRISIDGRLQTDSLDNILRILDNFYQANGVDSDATV